MPEATPGVMTPTPAASPSPNPGAEANAAGQITQALRMLEQALPQLGVNSPLHQAVRKAIDQLAKNIPASAGQQPINSSMLRDMALRQQQQHPLLAALQARGAQGGGAPGGAPGGMPPGGPT